MAWWCKCGTMVLFPLAYVWLPHQRFEESLIFKILAVFTMIHSLYMETQRRRRVVAMLFHNIMDFMRIYLALSVTWQICRLLTCMRYHRSRQAFTSLFPVYHTSIMTTFVFKLSIYEGNKWVSRALQFCITQASQQQWIISTSILCITLQH